MTGAQAFPQDLAYYVCGHEFSKTLLFRQECRIPSQGGGRSKAQVRSPRSGSPPLIRPDTATSSGPLGTLSGLRDCLADVRCPLSDLEVLPESSLRMSTVITHDVLPLPSDACVMVLAISRSDEPMACAALIHVPCRPKSCPVSPIVGGW